jgi:hypothetical protein
MATQRSAAYVADIDLLDRFDVDDELDIDEIVDLLGLRLRLGDLGLGDLGLADAGRRRSR